MPRPGSAGNSQPPEIIWNFCMDSCNEVRMDAVLFQPGTNLGLHWLSCSSCCQETAVYVRSAKRMWGESLKLKETPSALLATHGERGHERATDSRCHSGITDGRGILPTLSTINKQITAKQARRICHRLGPQVHREGEGGKKGANWM